jgi:hypothetical protein
LIFYQKSNQAGSCVSTLKALITEETLMIEPKGVDPFPVRNCIHLIMSSNADWVVPAGAEARRYFVLNVADTHIQDSDYFEAIVRQMETGGREALLDLLGDRDLSDFNIRSVPQTEALAEQKQHSRRGIDWLIENITHGGVLPSAHSIQHNIAITTGEERGEGFYPAARAIAWNAQQVLPKLLYHIALLREQRAHPSLVDRAEQFLSEVTSYKLGTRDKSVTCEDLLLGRPSDSAALESFASTLTRLDEYQQAVVREAARVSS